MPYLLAMADNLAYLLDKAKGFPEQPGVYFMKDPSGRILYIGKAKKLRDRVKSYFLKQENLANRTQVLVKKIHDIEFTVTTTELEALLLECNLIKKHRPRYNVRLKDDKNYPYVVLDFTHPFPQFRITRKVFFSPHLKYFGPFSGGATEIGRFLLKTFQIRDCSDSKFKNRTRPCLNYEIGTCTAPCVAYVTEEDYAKQVKQAILFLQGKKASLIKEIKTQMLAFSDKQEFEAARNLRDKMQALIKISQKQSTVLAGTQRDIDVIGCFENEESLQWVVLFIRAGLMTGRRTQKTPLDPGMKGDSIRTFLEQFYMVSLVPDEVWLSQDFPDRELIEKYLSDKAGKVVKVRVPRSEQPMRLLGMAYENAKLIAEEQTKTTEKAAPELLQKALNLKEPPHHIEGMDVSNLQGGQPVISLVHFADERPLKSQYRLYYPKTVEGQNDFAMIYEACLRRFGNPNHPPPDLLLIDGGKGQLQSAMKALNELKMDVPLCSIAKSRTQSSFTLEYFYWSTTTY
jgi:excinuclease ABC subunit C